MNAEYTDLATKKQLFRLTSVFQVDLRKLRISIRDSQA